MQESHARFIITAMHLLLFPARVSTRDRVTSRRVTSCRVPILLGLCLSLAAGVADAATPAWEMHAKPADWYETDEARLALDRIASWQNANGGWQKGYNADHPRPAPSAVAEVGAEPAAKPAVEPAASRPVAPATVVPHTAASEPGIFDNGSTIGEIRLMARAFTLTGAPRYRDAFDRGLAFVLQAQYPSGGWPQVYPPPTSYHRHVTFNDNVIAGVLSLLRDVAAGKGDYAFTTPDQRQSALTAWNRGLDLVLATQIDQGGLPTGWCQQYDADTLQPTGARTFELPGIAAGESAGILLLLMRIENPDARVCRAIHAGVAWFDRSKITGMRIERREVEGGLRPVLVPDPSAPTLWARFYDIQTNKPFFVGRDGIKRWSLDEVEVERAGNYAWYRQWGTRVFDAYAAWLARTGQPSVLSNIPSPEARS